MAYCILTFLGTFWLMVDKWRHTDGLARAQFQYLGAGALLSIAGGVTTNLVFPLITGRSTYSWLGPYFLLPFVMLVAHAIIRLRLMDLRLFIHRSLSLAAAVLMSLLPVALCLLFVWSRISLDLGPAELLVLLAAIVAATLLAPPTRDWTNRLFDRYLYRTQANFRRTVREASGILTRVLDLQTVLAFVTTTARDSTQAEGAAVYLADEGAFGLARVGREPGPRFEAPAVMPPIIVGALAQVKDCLVTDEVLRRSDSPESRALHDALDQGRWGLVVPVVAENSVIAAVVLGRKRSGDAFYPHDMDLLMTLANQAGIAIKNAQLYTAVVLANEYIQNIVETIESGVVAIDAPGRISLFNRAAEQLTGLTASAIRQQRVEALPADLGALLRDTVRDGQPRTRPEIEIAGADLARPVICATSPLRDQAGAVVGAVAVFSDLTPVKELESQRRRGERLAQFEALASSIAHEIKNPLVAIKTFAQLISRRQQDARFIDEFSRVVTREIGRMERLVDRLRMLSRPGERPRQRLDLRAPVTEAVEFLQPSFDEKRVALEAVIDARPACVLGDHSELEALFINLLLNALEATPPGGAVCLTVTVAGDAVTVTVADTGPGIPADQVERIFEPFFTTKPHGSGLGLTICAGIASGHRAKLRAANGPGGGALFTMEFLPAPPAADPVPNEVKTQP